MKFVIDRIEGGAVSYVNQAVVADIFRASSGRVWLYKNAPSTIMYSPYLSASGARAKSTQRFAETPDVIGRFLEEFSGVDGKHLPSSFAAGFGLFARHGNPSATSQAFFGKRIVGAWQSAIRQGDISGPLWKYDLNSAYADAAMRGLPAPDSFCLSRDVTQPGLYIFRGVCESERKPPFPFVRGLEKTMMATDGEIKLYSIRVLEVYWGQSWRAGYDVRPSIDRVRETFTDWKKVLRSFWGRWAARRGPECGEYENGRIKRSHRLPNNMRNFIWAHLILSRVRARMWSEAPNAVHVFVDSVIVPHPMKVGSNIGEWKLEKEYPQGVTIFRTGVYRDNSTGKLDKHCGLSGPRVESEEDKAYGYRDREIEREEENARSRNRAARDARDEAASATE